MVLGDDWGTPTEGENEFGQRDKPKIEVKTKAAIHLPKAMSHFAKTMKPYDDKKTEKKLSKRKEIGMMAQVFLEGEVTDTDSFQKDLMITLAEYCIEVYNSDLNGSLEMLNFEALELVENKYIKPYFQEFLHKNSNYKKIFNSLISKSQSYLSDLQTRLSKSSEFGQGTDENTLKEGQLVKEFSSSLLYLGKYYKGALKAVLEENKQSTLSEFDTLKMCTKATRR